MGPKNRAKTESLKQVANASAAPNAVLESHLILNNMGSCTGGRDRLV